MSYTYVNRSVTYGIKGTELSGYKMSMKEQ